MTSRINTMDTTIEESDNCEREVYLLTNLLTEGLGPNSNKTVELYFTQIMGPLPHRDWELETGLYFLAEKARDWGFQGGNTLSLARFLYNREFSNYDLVELRRGKDITTF